MSGMILRFANWQNGKDSQHSQVVTQPQVSSTTGMSPCGVKLRARSLVLPKDLKHLRGEGNGHVFLGIKILGVTEMVIVTLDTGAVSVGAAGTNALGAPRIDGTPRHAAPGTRGLT